MGLLIAKFRKTKSNSELLESIEKDINAIESFQRNTEQQRKKIIGQFLMFSVGVYLCSATLIYFYFYPKNMKERLIYLVPFVFAPFFIFSMKKLLTMYYNRILRKNETKLVNLRASKKKILETIMETETYKVARGILEKYAPEQIQKTQISSATPLRSMTPLIRKDFVRNRFPANANSSMGANLSTSMTVTKSNFANNSSARGFPDARTEGRLSSPTLGPRPLLPRAILPKDRTFLDRMVEYLVGDGPSNRYALICKECSGHNGMALMDEFEYVSFKCCYCSAFNPSRKKRPAAPKLNLSTPNLTIVGVSAASDSEKHSASDSEEAAEEESVTAAKVETLDADDANNGHGEGLQQEEKAKEEEEEENKEEAQSNQTEEVNSSNPNQDDAS